MEARQARYEDRKRRDTLLAEAADVFNLMMDATGQAALCVAMQFVAAALLQIERMGYRFSIEDTLSTLVVTTKGTTGIRGVHDAQTSCRLSL
jgi:hypothetical protein